MVIGIEEAKKLLDFRQKLDINLLDNVVNTMYTGDGAQILTHLKENPEAWTRVDTILEFSSNQQTKYYALQILENAIKVRWKALPPAQCDGIKKFIVNLIIKISSSPELVEKEKIYLGKLNIILVQILKKEWPHNWPTFISEIVGACKSNESICQNNMIILKLLSEEVFDFSSGQMTQNKIKHLKEQICKEFMQIFTLCQFVLDNSNNASLVLATLETLLKFLGWIPLGYIFETKLIDTLVQRFLVVPLFRNVTLQCLTEIAGLRASQYDEKFETLYLCTMKQLKTLIPLGTANLASAYATGTDEEQNFIQNLSLFLSTFFKEHGSLIENKAFLEENTSDSNNVKSIEIGLLNGTDKDGGIQNYNAELGELGLVTVGGVKEALIQGHYYLLLISRVDEIEIFKICLEYWNFLAASLYKERPVSSHIFGAGAGMGGLYNGVGLNGPGTQVPMPQRWRLYSGILTKLRVIIVSRMARPEEVLVVENDQGEVVREFMKDTDAINLYKNMRETLVYLTHLDYADTERIMLDKLEKQVNGEEWSWKNLNSLCWAMGSISGAMCEDDEKRFLVTVIKDLLFLCEQKRGKDNKAIVASDIMYVVGQYPRFLKAHWKFLKTVINKLFEFMHETHEGVQDMACDTFIKIAHKCRRHFIQIQPGEIQPFVEEILNNTNHIICDLSPHQVHVFYEAVGMMIASASVSPTAASGHSSYTNPFGGGTPPTSFLTSGNQEALIQKYMALPNQAWDDIVEEASKNVEILKDPNIVRQLGNILKTNIRACKSLEHVYVSQLAKIYLDMLNLYQVMNGNIIAAFTANGPAVNKQPIVVGMRAIKKDILKLINSWISIANDPKLILENFVTPLLEAILPSYKTDPSEVKEPEVLSTVTTIIAKLGGPSGFHGSTGAASPLYTTILPAIMEAVFEPTLGMISGNFTDWPEHRLNFYEFLKVVVEIVLPPGPAYAENGISRSSSHSLLNGVSGDGGFKSNSSAADLAANDMETEKDYRLILSFDINQPGGGPRFKLIFDSIVWGIKHTMRNVAEISLEILTILLKNVESRYESRVAQGFYLPFYTTIIEHMFAVVSDTSLTADLPAQSTILAHLFGLPERGRITVNLNPALAPPTTPAAITLTPATAELIAANIEYTRVFVLKMLQTAFAHLTLYQLNVTIQGFFTLNHDLSAFKEHLRDFLVQIREFSGTDDSDLYLSEKEAAIKKAQEDKLATISNIPGMIKPSEMNEEMQQ